MNHANDERVTALNAACYDKHEACAAMAMTTADALLLEHLREAADAAGGGVAVTAEELSIIDNYEAQELTLVTLRRLS